MLLESGSWRAGITATYLPAGRGKGYIASKDLRCGDVLLREQCASMILVEWEPNEDLVKLDSTAIDKKFIGSNKRLAEETRRVCAADPTRKRLIQDMYNIALKSLGAAKKKHAAVRLDGVLDYAEPLPDNSLPASGKGGEGAVEKGRGYYFMDSPGNDLESIAGQVASGCNVVYFVTGNGSITNFPFAPTLKILTTTRRYKHLSKDMDFNAGRYQDAKVSMDDLGQELFDMTVRAASGARTKGELAEHSQVSIWRSWAQTEAGVDLKQFSEHRALQGKGLPASAFKPLPTQPKTQPKLQQQQHLPGHYSFVACAERPSTGKLASQRIGLVLPTSLCSGQIAAKIAAALNGEGGGQGEVGVLGPRGQSVDKFVALPHNEGCGSGFSEGGEHIYNRVISGHLLHPNVRFAVLLEHGCEKYHNDHMANYLKANQIDVSRYGLASVQGDGGIDSVSAKVREWFQERMTMQQGKETGGDREKKEEEKEKEKEVKDAKEVTGGTRVALLGELTVGIACPPQPPLPAPAATLLSALVRLLLQSGCTVVLPENAALLQSAAFLDELMEAQSVQPSLLFGQRVAELEEGAAGGGRGRGGAE